MSWKEVTTAGGAYKEAYSDLDYTWHKMVNSARWPLSTAPFPWHSLNIIPNAELNIGSKTSEYLYITSCAKHLILQG